MNNSDKRNVKGVIGFFILSLLFNIFTMAIMLYREYKQYTDYGIDFEFDDVKRYTIAICAGSIVQMLLIYFLFG